MSITDADAQKIATAVWYRDVEEGEPQEAAWRALDVAAEQATLAADKAAEIERLLDGLQAPVLDAVVTALDDLRMKVVELANRPLIDAVAVANAIAAHPEIATMLALQVADRLGALTGEILLSGTLTGIIRP